MLTVAQLGAFIGVKFHYKAKNGSQGIGKIDVYTLDKVGVYEDEAKPFLKPCNEMSPEELAEWTGEKGFTEDAAKFLISKFSSIWGLHTFIGQHGNYDSISWLCSKGFDPFFYISRDLAIHVDKLPEFRQICAEKSKKAFDC